MAMVSPGKLWVRQAGFSDSTSKELVADLV
jgi:hypothetical protein